MGRISKVIILCFAFPTMGFGAEINFTRSGNQLFASSSDCQMLERNLRALATWRKRLSQPTAQIQMRRQGNMCIASLENIAPNFVYEMHSTHAGDHGPNCWNAALVANQIIPYRRYSDTTEFEFIASSPLCHPLKEGESPQPGDVGAVATTLDQGAQVNRRTHGFIYVSPELIFQKGGVNKKWPYELADIKKSVEETYEWKDGETFGGNKCFNTQKPLKGCGTIVSFFRCDKFEEYIKKNENNIDSEVKELMHQADTVDCSVSQVIENGLVKSTLRTLSPSVAVLKAVVVQDLKRYTPIDYSKPNPNVFLLNVLLNRIQTIEKNITTLPEFE
jgi:hypothetical protein